MSQRFTERCRSLPEPEPYPANAAASFQPSADSRSLIAVYKAGWFVLWGPRAPWVPDPCGSSFPGTASPSFPRRGRIGPSFVPLRRDAPNCTRLGEPVRPAPAQPSAASRQLIAEGSLPERLRKQALGQPGTPIRDSASRLRIGGEEPPPRLLDVGTTAQPCSPTAPEPFF